jgi:integrase/recombinase XerD
MNSTPTIGAILHSFFIDHLKVERGLRPTSISSYRDALRLFLIFVAKEKIGRITKLNLKDFTCDRVLKFLHSLEEKRGNHVRTRNQRLAVLKTFFQYLGQRIPEILVESEKVAKISVKRSSPAVTHYLDRDEIELMFSRLPSNTGIAHRNRTLLLFLYNTGARVEETASLKFAQLELGVQPYVRLYGKGGKWRTCPLWKQTVDHLKELLERLGNPLEPDDSIFVSQRKLPLTRFGIYKIVRRCASHLDQIELKGNFRRVTPHLFRHYAEPIFMLS